MSRFRGSNGLGARLLIEIMQVRILPEVQKSEVGRVCGHHDDVIMCDLVH